MASSYLPDRAAGVAADETILDDKYGLYAANPERWLMRPAGADASAESALASSANLSAPDRPRFDGDMTEPVGVVTAAGLVRERFVGPTGYGATLYTSDAGIDVSADYNRQEESTAVLNFGQVLCGLLALAPGGALITKQYTFATPFSRQLLMIVASAFERTHIVKPRTSRPANSEVYLFGEGFRGLPADVAARLVMCLAAAKSADEARSPLPPLLRHGVLAAPDADRALLRISHSLAQVQIRYLREIVAVFDGCGRQPERAREVARAFAAGAAAKAQRSWLAANPLVRLAPSDQIKAARL